jgi:hypothetical protein
MTVSVGRPPFLWGSSLPSGDDAAGVAGFGASWSPLGTEASAGAGDGTAEGARCGAGSGVFDAGDEIPSADGVVTSKAMPWPF